MRKMSASRGRQSERKERNMRFSPFWLKMRMPESMVVMVNGEGIQRGELGSSLFFGMCGNGRLIGFFLVLFLDSI